MKKKFMLAGCLIAMLCMTTACGKSSDSVTYIMSDVQEGDHPSAVACDKFAKLVYDKTDGRVNIEVYHGDTLGSETDQLSQITVGGIDFARISGPLTSYEDDLKAFQALYLYDDEDDMWDILNGSVGDELLNSEDLTSNNIVGLGWYSGGSRNFYNNQHEITTPADLKGLTLRVNTDPMIKLLANNGATPINIAYNDIYDSIKDGAIDGAENNWPSYISTGHYEVAKYITVDKHTCIPEMLVASQSALDSMSEEDQATVKECAKEISEYQIQAMKDYEEEAIKTAQNAGCVITELTDAQSQAFKEEGQKVNDELYSDYTDVINKITGK